MRSLDPLFLQDFCLALGLLDNLFEKESIGFGDVKLGLVLGGF